MLYKSKSAFAMRFVSPKRIAAARIWLGTCIRGGASGNENERGEIVNRPVAFPAENLKPHRQCYFEFELQIVACSLLFRLSENMREFST